MTRKLEYIIDKDYAGCRVQAFLKSHGYSSRMIKDLKKNPHGILIGNKKVTVLKQLRRGDKLTVYIKDPVQTSVVPVNLPIGIVYEDKDVIVCDKPAFMATHPSQGNYDNTLANALAYHFQQTGRQCAVRFVNRLDKNTSGLILAAKNAYASAVLSDALKEKRIHRSYLAFVEGCPRPAKGVIDAPIVRQECTVIKRCVDFDIGARAVTHYKVLRQGEFSLVRLWLETGRTHQIRVHMSYIGTPVAGDFLYGHEHSAGIGRHALHSASLEFCHPLSGEKLSFVSALPQDMLEIYQKQWGEYNETACI